MRTQHFCCLVLAAALLTPAAASDLERLAPGVTVVHGAVNGFLVERNGKVLAVYGDPREDPPAADLVLFTHARRDVTWAGRELVDKGARAVAPAAEANYFLRPAEFWQAFEQKRFHDYAQPTTKVPVTPIKIERQVRDGDVLNWEGLPIRVLDTPGYTRGAVSYVLEADGRKIALTGDLIYGDGMLWDLYSLQDAIPEAGIRGYHGYAARLADVIGSLRKIAAEQPDILVPVRGPVIREPRRAIDTLIARIHALYANYLSIDALRWYFHDEHILKKARRVLGPDAHPEWMPMAETVQETLPSWIIPIRNSRLIVSRDGSGFLVDCGFDAIIERLDELRAEKKLTHIEHIFITHYHDDHTDRVAKLVRQTGATVHATFRNRDVLEHPARWRLPAMTANPIHISAPLTSGARWRWKEFEMRIFYFPGQTIHHDALLVTADSGEQFFFIGDSFTPAGIDDYCLQNRDLLHSGMGYDRCLRIIRQYAPDALLINQHVPPAFRFSPAQLDRIEETLAQRKRLLQRLLPWDDPNWGIDEGWARFYPYGASVRPGEPLQLELRIMNHSPHDQVFHARLRLPKGWAASPATPPALRLSPRKEGSIAFTVTPPKIASPGLRIVTADVKWADRDLRSWTEAMVRVKD